MTMLDVLIADPTTETLDILELIRQSQEPPVRVPGGRKGESRAWQHQGQVD